MDDSERAPQSRVIAVCAQLQVLEHEERLFAPLSSTQWDGNPGTGRDQRRETVGLGGETVKLRAVVDFREIFATTALEYEATVHATSPRTRPALSSARPFSIRNPGLPPTDQLRGCP